MGKTVTSLSIGGFDIPLAGSASSPVNTTEMLVTYTDGSTEDFYLLDESRAVISSETDIDLSELENRLQTLEDVGAEANVQSDWAATSGDAFILNKPALTAGTGIKSMLFGNASKSSNDYSLAEGDKTTASGKWSHAEGASTTAAGIGSHAEGNASTASGHYSHAQGEKTTASGDRAHSEGISTTASGRYSHAEGQSNTAKGEASHAEGYSTAANGNYSHSTGYSTIADGEGSYSSGYQTHAYNQAAHSEGKNTHARGVASHTEGHLVSTDADYAHAEGYGTSATGSAAHAEGSNSVASGSYGSHAEGGGNEASGHASHAEGGHWKHFAINGDASSLDSAGGRGTIATGNASHSEGIYTRALGDSSHAQGFVSFAEGKGSHAGGNAYHALWSDNVELTVDGSNTWISSDQAMIPVGSLIMIESEDNVITNAVYEITTVNQELNTYHMGFDIVSSVYLQHNPYKVYILYASKATNNGSFVHGAGLQTARENQTIVGEFNRTHDIKDALFVVGNGDPGTLSNAFIIDEHGNAVVQGTLTFNDTSKLNGTRMFEIHYVNGNSESFRVPVVEE